MSKENCEIKDFMDEKGFLTEKGKEFLYTVKSDLSDMLSKTNSQNEARVLGSALHKFVGDLVSAEALKHK